MAKANSTPRLRRRERGVWELEMEASYRLAELAYLWNGRMEDACSDLANHGESNVVSCGCYRYTQMLLKYRLVDCS